MVNARACTYVVAVDQQDEIPLGRTLCLGLRKFTRRLHQVATLVTTTSSVDSCCDDDFIS